jgi:hypothetical protein
MLSCSYFYRANRRRAAGFPARFSNPDAKVAKTQSRKEFVCFL